MVTESIHRYSSFSLKYDREAERFWYPKPLVNNFIRRLHLTIEHKVAGWSFLFKVTDGMLGFHYLEDVDVCVDASFIGKWLVGNFFRRVRSISKRIPVDPLEFKARRLQLMYLRPESGHLSNHSHFGANPQWRDAVQNTEDFIFSRIKIASRYGTADLKEIWEEREGMKYYLDMSTLVVKPKTRKSRSAFRRSWRNLPIEIQVDILSKVLVMSYDVEEDSTFYNYIDPVIDVEDYGNGGRFERIAMPILACSEIHKSITLEIWYGNNPIRFGQRNRKYAEAARYRFLLPPRRAFVFLQEVEIPLRLDREGWEQLRDYCEAIKEIPLLKYVDLELIEYREQAPEELEDLEDAIDSTGPLAFATKNLTITYRDVGQLIGMILQPTHEDCYDYPGSNVVFDNIGIKVAQGEVVNSELERFWSNYEMTLSTDAKWTINPEVRSSHYVAWHKRMVKTMWV
ncbi:hypothetical protein N0V90_000040 [Kalmusia sp. IMI 367209]|nr:hypothetical protein N0V90_000040 [Kalmusia sp. IMI 367209]